GGGMSPGSSSRPRRSAPGSRPRCTWGRRARPRTCPRTLDRAMRNAEIALHFDELADLYELDGAVSYRVIAYRNAAKSIREANASVEEMTKAGRVTELPGIGKTLE